MPRKKTRSCLACGKSARGHEGPMGHGKCLYDLQKRGELSGTISEASLPTHRQTEKAPNARVPSGSGMAEANSRGPQRGGSPTSAHLGAPSSTRDGGIGPHRYASVVGMSGGQPVGGAGAPQIQPDLTIPRGRTTPHVRGAQLDNSHLRVVSPARPRPLADMRPIFDVCATPGLLRRDSSCPPVISSPRPADFRGPTLSSQYPDRPYYPDHPISYREHDGAYTRQGHQFHYEPYYEGHRDIHYQYRERVPVDRHIRPGQPDPGSFENPLGAEHVTLKARTTALAGECIDLSEFLSSATSIPNDQEEYRTTVDIHGNLSLKALKAKKFVNTSYRWLEAWTSYEILLCTYYGLKVFQEMAAYRLFIISLFAKYKLPHVLSYDLKHRQYMGAKHCLAFSSYTHQLYSYQLFVTTFDGNSLKSVSRCGKCSSTDHVTLLCPFQAPGQTQSLPSRQTRGDRPADRQGDRQGDRADKGDLCLLYQDGKCKSSKCSRKHVCMGCGGPDGFKACNRCIKALKNVSSSSS